MADKLGDQHTDQYPRASKVSGYRASRCWYSGDVLATAENQLRTRMENHLKSRGDVLQHLRHIHPQIAKLPAAPLALRLRLVDMVFAWQVFMQRLALRDDARCRFDWRCQFSLTCV